MYKKREVLKRFLAVGLSVVMTGSMCNNPGTLVANAQESAMQEEAILQEIAESVSGNGGVMEDITLPEREVLEKAEYRIPEKEELYVEGVYVEVGDYELRVVGTNATITKYNGKEKDVEIPARMSPDGETYYNITAIGPEAFYYQNIKTVVIPKGVESIGYGAFAACLFLKEVTLPNTLTSIGEYAFEQTDIEYINIPEGVTVIDDCAFSFCENLWWVSLPKSLTSLGYFAFSNCGRLKEIEIPEGITKIEDYTFARCDKLEKVSIPNSVTWIGSGAFEQCYALESIGIPDSVTRFGFSVFAYCTKLKNIKLSKAQKVIKDGTFWYCAALEEIELPDGITAIKDHAFYNCSELKSINIPESVTEIGKEAFYGCTSLQNLTLPKGVTSIGESAFHKCPGLKSLVLPEGRATVLPEEFSDCFNLQSITVPKTVIMLGNKSFYNCQSLTEIIIPENVTTIGAQAFYGCSSMESVEFPSAVTQIEEEAFAGCDNANITLNVVNDITISDKSSYTVADKNVKLTDNKQFAQYTLAEGGGITNLSGESISVNSIATGENMIVGNNEGVYSITYKYPDGTAITEFDDATKAVKYYKSGEGVKNLPELTKENYVFAGWYSDPQFTNQVTEISSTDRGVYTLYAKFATGMDSLQVTFAVRDSFIYNGREIRPAVIVKNGNTTLVKGTDYVVTYQNAVNAANKDGQNPPTITIQGKGDYAGTKTVTYTIQKAQDAPNMPQATMTVTGNYTKVGDVNLPQGWGWQDAYKETALTTGTSVNATAEYIGADKANYQNTTVSITLTMPGEQASTKEEQTSTKEEQTAVKVGETLNDKDGKATYEVTVSEEGKVEVNYVEPVNTKSKTVTIPDTVTLSDGTAATVTNISAQAFKGNTQITKITLGSNVETIGKEAFSGCTNLKTVKMGKNVTTIGNNAFANCKKLTTVSLSSKLTTIGDKAFYKCTALKKITIPSKVSKIGKQAFYGCKNLKSITIKTTKLTSKKVGSKAFKGTPATTKIKVPKSKVSAYQKLFVNKGVSKKAKISK